MVVKVEKSNLFANPLVLIKDKIVALGGSFNPPTIAHQELIKQVLKYEPQKVILIPNGDDYCFDNINKTLVPFKMRAHMCELLFEGLGFNNYEINEIENSHMFKGTFDSLRVLNHPTFIIGDDCLFSLKRWLNFKTLVSENCFVVFTRHEKQEQLEKYIINDEFLCNFSSHFGFIHLEMPDISSTLFRKSHQTHLVCPNIYQYILKNNLYGVNHEK